MNDEEFVNDYKNDFKKRFDKAIVLQRQQKIYLPNKDSIERIYVDLLQKKTIDNATYWQEDYYWIIELKSETGCVHWSDEHPTYNVSATACSKDRYYIIDVFEAMIPKANDIGKFEFKIKKKLYRSVGKYFNLIEHAILREKRLRGFKK